MKGDTTTVIILFAVIIGISLWISHATCMKMSKIANGGYIPYSKNNIGGSTYTKEGFHTVENQNTQEMEQQHQRQ